MEKRIGFPEVVNNLSNIDLQFAFNNREHYDSQNSYREEDLIKSGSNSNRISEEFSNHTSNISYVLDSIDHQQVYVEENDSSSELSIIIEPITLFVDGIEVLSTPYDYIFSNRSILSLKVLMEDAEKETQVMPSRCFLKLFQCAKEHSNSDFNELKKKIICLGRIRFDYKQSFHGNLMLT